MQRNNKHAIFEEYYEMKRLKYLKLGKLAGRLKIGKAAEIMLTSISNTGSFGDQLDLLLHILSWQWDLVNNCIITSKNLYSEKEQFLILIIFSPIFYCSEPEAKTRWLQD